METKPQFFDYQQKDGRTINCHYFFSDDYTNPGTEKVDLYIRFEDPKRPNVLGFTCREDKALMSRTYQEMVKLCTYELNVYYKQCPS